MNNNFKKGKVWEGEKMYMDSDIPIPEKLPQYIIDDLKHLQELYDSKEPNHDLLWDLYWEGVESGIKNACCEGQISKKDANQLFRRYGLFD